MQITELHAGHLLGNSIIKSIQVCYIAQTTAFVTVSSLFLINYYQNQKCFYVYMHLES